MDLQKISKVLLILLIISFVPLSASVSQVDVLVVDDGHSLSYYTDASYEDRMFEGLYNSSLQSMKGVNVDFYRTDTNTGPRGPSYQKLKKYDAVVWYTLADYGDSRVAGSDLTLYEQDRKNLEKYLKKGGSLYLTGQFIQSDLKGTDFYNAVMSVQYREGSSSPSFWRYTDSRSTSPSDWKFERVRTGQVEAGDNVRMKYEGSGGLVLKSERDASLLGPETFFDLNTTIQTPRTLGVITDTCHNEVAQDSEGKRSCSNAVDSVNWQNNIPLNTVTSVTRQNSASTIGNTNEYLGDGYLSLSFDADSSDPVLLAAVTVYKEDYEGYISASYGTLHEGYYYGASDMKEVASVENSKTVTKVFKLEKPSDGDTVMVWTDDSGLKTAISAYEYTNVDLSNPVGELKVESGTSNSGVSLHGKDGDKVLSFLAQKGDSATASGSLSSVVSVENSPNYHYMASKPANGTENVAWSSNSNYTHVGLVLNSASEFANYYVETDGDMPVTYAGNSGNIKSSDRPDEYASGLVKSFNHSYRTVHSTFGFEAVKGKASRENLMHNIVRYLTGPLADSTSVEAYYNWDLPETEKINENKYTSGDVYISSTGMNLENPSGLENARYFYNYSSQRLGPVFETGFENETRFKKNWVVNNVSGGYEEIGSQCSVKKGQKSLVLNGKEEGDNDHTRDDDVVNITSRAFDVSASPGLVLEMWVRSPPGYDESGSSKCNGPDEDREDLSIYYKNSTSSWEQLKYLEGEGPHDWRDLSIPISKEKLSSGFKIRIKKHRNDYDNAWIIDELELHSKLYPQDNNFDSGKEVAELGPLDATEVTADLSSVGDGVNVTYGVQFKDSSKQGYWGPIEKDWIIVDTRPPKNPLRAQITEDYVNTSTAYISIRYQVVEDGVRNTVPEGLRADLVRFSCKDDSSTQWTDWKRYNNSREQQKFTVNITSADSDCNDLAKEGNRTVYVDIRDFAGNKPSSDVSDWVIRDTTKPDFTGAQPKNRSAVKKGIELNITVSDKNPLSKGQEAPQTTFNYSRAEIQFTPNSTFPSEFGQEGLKTAVAKIYDKASNLRKVFLNYDVDDTPPEVNVTPENSGVPENNTDVRPSYNMTVEVTDRNFERLVVNDGDNSTFTRRTVDFDPDWSEGVSKDLVIYTNDSAGNLRVKNYTYTVDGSSPVLDAVKVANRSYIKGEETLAFNFSDSITVVVGSSSSEGSIILDNWDLGVNPSWSEGSHKLTVRANDTVSNQLEKYFQYTVDTTAPEVFTNYSSEAWRETNVTLGIKAYDNYEMDTISYCIRNSGGGCSLDRYSAPDQNVTLEIGCVQGSTCQREVIFNGNDSAGNKYAEDFGVSPAVRIDKEGPSISEINPPQGAVSGSIELSASIKDVGSGLADVNFTVFNRSDPSQVFVEGDPGGDMSFTWDSEVDISSSENVTLNISARDSLGHISYRLRDFTVDNENTTVSIQNPSGIVGSGFFLDIVANRPGTEDLNSHNYTVLDGQSQVYRNTTFLSGSNHRYSVSFPTESISNDGNYTLNTTALGGGEEFATSETWFFLDRQPPSLKISSKVDEWERGDVQINFEAFDAVKNRSIYWRYRDNGGNWHRTNLEYGDTSFTFPTSNCDNDDQPNCEVQLVAKDSVGNVNKSTVSFKVDNTPPEASIDSPESSTWHKESFEVERTAVEDVASSGLECEVKVESSAWKNTGSCNSSITVDIPEDCGNGNQECSVSFRATNPAGASDKDTAYYKIDTEKPEVPKSYPRPSPGTVINGSERIEFVFNDNSLPGVTYARWKDGGQNLSVESGKSYEPAWTESGEKTIELVLNDSAGNIFRKRYSYIFDNRKPLLRNSTLSVPEDEAFEEVRVYRGEKLTLDLNISENTGAESVKATVEKAGVKTNKTLEIESGDEKNGVWSTGLDTSSTGVYNITATYITDKAGNTAVNASGLPAYHVINYSESLSLGGSQEIDAGVAQAFEYSIDFNRTQGERKVELDIPSVNGDPYFNVEDLSCSTQGCNVSDEGNLVDLNYSGDNQEITVSGTAQTVTPENDKSLEFVTELLGNRRSTQVKISAPNLTVNNVTCSPDCTINQSQNFTLEVTLENTRTADNTGKAFGTELKVDLDNSTESVDMTENIGSVVSGGTESVSFANISYSKAGNVSIETVFKDSTGNYSDNGKQVIQVLDIQKPRVKELAAKSDRVNVNGTVTISANLTDNTGVTEANITVKKPDDTRKNLSLEKGKENTWTADFNSTRQKGVYNITDLHVSDQRANTRHKLPNETFKVTELKIKASVNETNITTDEPVKFKLDISGNSTELFTVTLNVTRPGKTYKLVEYADMGLNDNITYEGFRNSGNYSFEVIAEAGLSVATKTSDVFVQYGNGGIRPLDGNSTTVLIPDHVSEVNTTWALETSGGGLENVSLRFETADSGVVSAVRSSEKEVGDLTFNERSQRNGFLITPESIGSTSVSMVMDPVNGSQNSRDFVIEVADTDPVPPLMENISLSEKTLNLNENLTFNADITDNSVLQNVTLIVEKPSDGSKKVVKMNQLSREKFSQTFPNTSEVGVYNYTVKAWDIEGNMKQREGNFTVTDSYRVEASGDQKIYVKEEDINIDLDVVDASGEKVSDYNVEANLTRGAGQEVELNAAGGTITTHIDTEDPPSETLDSDLLPMDYTFDISISKEGNSGSVVKTVDVTRLLNVTLSTRSDYVAPGGNFTVVADWSEPLEDPVAGGTTSFVVCEQCPSNYKPLNLNPATGNRVQTLTAPNKTGTLVFKVYGSSRGNSESQSLPEGEGTDAAPYSQIQVVPEGRPPNNTASKGGLASGGGIGGIGGGGPTMEITRVSPGVSIPPGQNMVNLTVNTNIAATCVYSRNAIPESVSFSEAKGFSRTGGVMHTEMLTLEQSMTYSYSVVCASDAVNSTTDIIFSKGERELSAFRPTFPETLTPGNASIRQDNNGSGFFTVYNNQSDPLNLEFELTSECCNVSVIYDGEKVSETTVQPGEEKGLRVSMYAPLYVKPGIHNVNLAIIGENASRQRSIEFMVKRHEQVQRYNELVQKAQILNSSIDRYRIAGIDTSKMRSLFRELESTLDNANSSIQNNNLKALKTSLDRAETLTDKIDTRLEDAAWKKYILLNWWKYALAFVIMYMIFFLVTIVGIPYYRIQTELTRINSQLESAVQARKKGEKQYFQRQIDKDTFNEMMQDRQNEVLELRGEKEDLKDELDGFLWEKLTLENYLKAPWKGMEELEKWWAANRRARQNLKQGDEENQNQ